MNTTRMARTDERYAALADVFSDRVRYHNGLTGPALGYTWADGGQMTRERQEVLRELRVYGLIHVETHRLFAHRGHAVVLTTEGDAQLTEWGRWAA